MCYALGLEPGSQLLVEVFSTVVSLDALDFVVGLRFKSSDGIL